MPRRLRAGGRSGRPRARAAGGALQTLVVRLRPRPGGCSWSLVALLAWRCAAASAAARRGARAGLRHRLARAGTWWLYISLHVYGGLPALAGRRWRCAAVRVLSLYLAAAWRRFARGAQRGRCADALLLRGAAGCSPSWCAACFFTGFPWGAGGYAHVDGPLAALAPGSASTAWASSSRFVGALARRWCARCGAAVRCSLVGARGAGRAGRCVRHRRPQALHAPDRHARPSTLLQGNIPQDEKFAARHRHAAALAWYARAAAAARPTLVVTPETAIPLLPAQLPQATATRSPQRFAAGAQAALVGMPLGDTTRATPTRWSGFDARARASGALSLRQAPPGAVRRIHPAGFHWFTRDDEHPAGRLQPRRRSAQPSFPWHGERARAQHLLRGPVRRGARGALRRRGAGADDLRQREQHRAGSATRSRSTSTCRSAACARSSSSGRCSARPTPAPPRSSTIAATSRTRCRRLTRGVLAGERAGPRRRSRRMSRWRVARSGCGRCWRSRADRRRHAPRGAARRSAD